MGLEVGLEDGEGRGLADMLGEGVPLAVMVENNEGLKG